MAVRCMVQRIATESGKSEKLGLHQEPSCLKSRSSKTDNFKILKTVGAGWRPLVETKTITSQIIISHFFVGLSL
jgi:hypothetical protein